ncbi:MAG: RDD family protein [Candidatus Berkiella sp.]
MKEINQTNLALFPPAPFFRRIAAMIYDSFIVFSFLLLATTIVLLINQGHSLQPYRLLFLSYLFISTGLFLGWFYKTSGQTLGMLAWKIRVVSSSGKPITWSQAIKRYALSYLSLGLAGIGILWCLFDKDKQSLHDKMLNIRVIKYQR